MPCIFGRGEAEKAELRELLELSNSQREEYRKAAEGASRRAEHVGKQLEARLCELQDLSSHYQALQQRESQLCRENDQLQHQVSSYKQSLTKAAVQQEDLTKQLHKEGTQRKQAETELRKLHKEREYLKMRVDRMQHALSILESVMDDTLRVSQNAGAGGDLKHASSSAVLRQSMDPASVQQLQEMIRSSKMGLGGGDAAQPADQR